ncbi:MAG: Ig-like domain-containing protein [Candidatus Nanopelagicales bacterium]
MGRLVAAVPRRAALVPFLVAAGIAVLLVVAGAAAAAPSWVITQQEGASRSTVTLSSSGLRFEASSATRRGAKARPQAGVIVRYPDAHLYLLDPERRLYDSVSLASAMASYAAEVKLARKGQPSDRLPGRPGAVKTSGQASLKRPAARLRPLALRGRIGTVRARAYLLHAGATRERLWYADGIPVPPARIRALLAKGAAPSASGSLARALTSRTGRLPLRIDQQRGKRWVTVLRTTRIRRVAASAALLQPPKGYRERNLLAQPAAARAADVPANPLRCALVITCYGILRGPISEHPDVYAFWWGTHYNARSDFVSAVNRGLHNMTGDEFADPNSKAFWGPLEQYGVGRGRLLGSKVVNENPDDSVGSWNFFDVEWFVTTHRYDSGVPTYWWRFSDHDPIFAIFVDQSQVDGSGWGGYHFFTPTEGLLFAFLAHPNMPWLIVKTPDPTTLPLDRGSAAFRQAVDQTTERASHEYVEAATDPYPFLSWADPLKEPIWEQGELGDICSQGNIAPYAKSARVLKQSTAFSTYWSNDDHACMPDSRPSLQLVQPSPGSSYGWGAQVTFLASGDDLFDGSLDASGVSVVWNDDKDGRIGTGRLMTTSALTPGTHHITVTATNSQGGTRTAGPVTVTMTVQPPQVRIDAPADGAAFGTDETINLRGSAFDPKDGDVSDQATWSVDGTPVGKGARLLPTQITTQGAHLVSLAYTNSGGLTANAAIKVNVGPPTGKPAVTITQPTLPPGYVDRYVTPGVPFTLAATADAQGVATIADSGYVWTSNLSGSLGTGPSIQATLPAGTHQVTVTVTDSLGRVGTDTVKIISQPVIG